MNSQIKYHLFLVTSTLIFLVSSLAIYLQQTWYTSTTLNTILFLCISTLSANNIWRLINCNSVLFLYNSYKDNKKYRTLRTIQLAEKVEQQSLITSQSSIVQQISKQLIEKLNCKQLIEKASTNKKTEAHKQYEAAGRSTKYIQNHQQIAFKKKFSKKNTFDLRDLAKVRTQQQKKIHYQQAILNTTRKQSLNSYQMSFRSQQGEINQQKLQERKSYYNQKYKKYKQTLKMLYQKQNINIVDMIKQTKQTIKNSILQSIDQQILNLTQIQTIVNNNFFICLKPLNAKKNQKQKLQHLNTLKQFEQKVKFNKIQQQTFSQMFGLIKAIQIGGDTILEFKGDKSKLKDIYLQLKKLIQKRIKLDSFIDFKIKKTQFCQIRYQNIQRLRAIANLLDQNQSNCRKIQRMFEQRESINFFIHFIINQFNSKLSQIGYGDSIKVVLNKPNFQNQNIQFIWIKKQGQFIKNHYDVVYKSFNSKLKQNKNNQIQELRTKQRLTKLNQIILNCPPGSQNIWVLIAFTRLCIQQLSNGFKDKLKSLPYDIRRLLAIYGFDLSNK